MAVKELGISPRRALETVLYIASRLTKPDVHEVLKIRYFADKLHFSEYGFPASGDQYFAMDFGPVATNIYDLLKVARGNGSDYDARRFGSLVKGALKVDSTKPHGVHALREANTDFLSPSDVESIEKAIAEYGALSFEERTKLSHDQAYEEAWAIAKQKQTRRHPMALKAIAGTLSNAHEVIESLSA